MKSFKEFLLETTYDYRSSHNAPNSEFGAPLHDVTQNGMYPSDIYSPKGKHLYGDKSEHDDLSIGIINKYKNTPDEHVTIYRAIPKNIEKAQINPKDWVSINKNYVKAHGEMVLGKGKYIVISKTVPAKHVYTNADSIHEWGYDPS